MQSLIKCPGMQFRNLYCLFDELLFRVSRASNLLMYIHVSFLATAIYFHNPEEHSTTSYYRCLISLR